MNNDRLHPPDLPEAFAGRLAKHVTRGLAIPEVPFVTGQPKANADGERCTFGLGLLPKGGGKEPFYWERPCNSPSCVDCAPRRARELVGGLRPLMLDEPKLHIYTSHGLDSEEFSRQEKQVRDYAREKDKNLGKGKLFWLQADESPSASLLAVSTIDLSSRGYNGRPGRIADQLSASEAVAIIHYYLWHGIYQRGATGGWNLPDSDYRKKQRSQNRRIAPMREHEFDQLDLEARRLYALMQADNSALPEWPDDTPTPLEEAEVLGLYQAAHQATRGRPRPAA